MRLFLLSYGLFNLLALSTIGYAEASEPTLSVVGKDVFCCEGYWSSTDGVWKITYRNDSLPWGTNILIKSGMKQELGHDKVDWHDIEKQQAKAIDKHTWELTVRRQVATRGGPRGTQLQFVIVILLPDDTLVYDKGSNSALGFYQVPLANCLHRKVELDKDEFCAIDVKSVIRN